MLTTRGYRYTIILIILFVLFNFTYIWRNRENVNYIRVSTDGHGQDIGMERYVKSTYNWGKLKPHFRAPTPMVHLPSTKPVTLPRIQHQFAPQSETTKAILQARRSEVKRAFRKCWKSYRKYAWMRDELTPVTGKGKDPFNGWGATLFDSLGTLWIMDLKDEFKQAVEAVAVHDWANTKAASTNTFETTIRYLGGLLSAYDLSGEKVLLLKAIELGDLLFASFDRPNHLPGFWMDFKFAQEGGLEDDANIPLAAPGSLSLEFTRLSQLSGDPKYYDAINRVTVLLDKYQNSTKLPGMWPIMIDLQRLDFHVRSEFTIGALADSTYEYLPKMHALLGGTDPIYLKMTKSAFSTIKNSVLFRPSLPQHDDILFAGSLYLNADGKKRLEPKMQHLACFAGGMFALGRQVSSPNEKSTKKL